MMTLQNAIESRRSRRKFLASPLDQSITAKLQAFIAEYSAKENLDMRLVLGNGAAFNGLRKSYGMFSGVQNYVGLIGDKTDLINTEKLGYYGELLVLHATALGFGTCWVGGSFHRASCPFDLRENESVICAIAIGNVSLKFGLKEKLIRGIVHRKTKTIEQMHTSSDAVPEWFLCGMKAVQMAPSAVNRQPVIFCYAQDGTTTASVKDITGDGFALDLGIAKLHFEIGAGSGAWNFGNGASFKKDS